MTFFQHFQKGINEEASVKADIREESAKEFGFRADSEADLEGPQTEICLGETILVATPWAFPG